MHCIHGSVTHLLGLHIRVCITYLCQPFSSSISSSADALAHSLVSLWVTPATPIMYSF